MTLELDAGSPLVIALERRDASFSNSSKRFANSAVVLLLEVFILIVDGEEARSCEKDMAWCWRRGVAQPYLFPLVEDKLGCLVGNGVRFIGPQQVAVARGRDRA